MKQHIFESNDFSQKAIARNETLFTVANGSFGLRGDFEEQKGTRHKGTYINGFFDSEPIQYGELAYGYAKNHQTILNLPDPKSIECYINSYAFSVLDGQVHSFSQKLNTYEGYMSRSIDWTAPDGSRVLIESKRIVPFTHDSSAVIEYRIFSKDKDITVGLDSAINTGIKNLSAEEDPRVGSKFSSNPLIVQELIATKEFLGFTALTRNSGRAIAGTVMHEIEIIGESTKKIQNPHSVGLVAERPNASWSIDLKKGESLILKKYICYKTSANIKKNDQEILEELKNTTNKKVNALRSFGFYRIVQEQKDFLKEFWSVAAIQVKGDPELEQALNFNIFHLLQSVGRDGKTSIAAKGLTAEGYEGHYFWDTEAYVCPVFTYIEPKIAGKLLEYRYSILPTARKRANEMSLKGALFPWRTIDGEETSAYYPAGTAQYHINADIMYALQKYLNAVGEDGFNMKHALEMGIETARMWMSLGSFIPSRDNKFCIYTVTGPDEYTACVNNNIYTNLLARENLKISINLVEKFGTNSNGVKAVTDAELHEWKKAEQEMYIPYDCKTGIYAQDDSFLDKPVWDFENTPKEKYPLLLHYHPLVIYRHQVLKQPDLVLAQMMLPEDFTIEEKKRNFLFYETLTTGDSSLSHCIQSIMACETGDVEKGLHYFEKTARMDIADKHGNTCDGIHTAAMAGSWMSIVYGFAGFRDYNGHWSFNPQLPKKWQSVSFSLRLGQSVLFIHIEQNQVTYRLKKGKKLHITHRYLKIDLVLDTPVLCSLKPKLQAVIFDLDGVITDTAELHYQAWKEIFDKEGLDFNKTINQKLKGVSRSESLEIVLQFNKAKINDLEKDRILKEKNDVYVHLLDAINEKDILPGIKSLLLELRKNGIKIALASASRNAKRICKKLGITDLFDAIIDPQSVKMSKPEPDIFYKAARMLHVWPTNCVGIEDAQAGIQAIKAAGMKAIGIGSSLTGADMHLTSTKKLDISKIESLFF